VLVPTAEESESKLSQLKPPVMEDEPPPLTPSSMAELAGLRLDFDDGFNVQTVYARYRPLGIKHNHTAPIVAESFSANSYAKVALGVRPGWRLTRIGRHELRDSTDFARVEAKLAKELALFPVWPLPIGFRTGPSADVKTVEFLEFPLGLEFSNKLPVKVNKVYRYSPADLAGVKAGWYLATIGDMSVEDCSSFHEVLGHLKEAIDALKQDGPRPRRPK